MKFCTICLCHNVAMNQKVVGQKLFNAVYTSCKLLVNADYVSVSMILFPLSVSSMPCNHSHYRS